MPGAGFCTAELRSQATVREGFLASFVPSEAARPLRPPSRGRVPLPIGMALSSENSDLSSREVPGTLELPLSSPSVFHTCLRLATLLHKLLPPLVPKTQLLGPRDLLSWSVNSSRHAAFGPPKLQMGRMHRRALGVHVSPAKQAPNVKERPAVSCPRPCGLADRAHSMLLPSCSFLSLLGLAHLNGKTRLEETVTHTHPVPPASCL